MEQPQIGVTRFTRLENGEIENDMLEIGYGVGRLSYRIELNEADALIEELRKAKDLFTIKKTPCTKNTKLLKQTSKKRGN